MNTARNAFTTMQHLLTSPATRAVLDKGMWGLADHALISLTNFVTIVLVARILTPVEFGIYALAYASLLFSNSIQSAIVVEPHHVLGATKSGPAFVTYTTGTAWIQLGLATLTAGAFLILAIIADLSNWWASPILWALVPASVAWQIQEFVRKVLYTKGNILAALRNDLISYGGQFVAIVLIWYAGELTASRAILALGATSFLGFLYGMYQIREDLSPRLGWQDLRQDAFANWSFGKWLLGGNLAYWTSIQIFPILAAGFVNVIVTGALRAFQTIFGPTNVLILALEPVFGPGAAQAYKDSGVKSLKRIIDRIQLLVGFCMGCYCLLVALFAAPILKTLYGDQYVEYVWLLVLMCALTFAYSLLEPIYIAFKATGNTQLVFQIHVISSIVNLTLGVALVVIWRLTGLVIGMTLNGILLQILIWKSYRRITRISPGKSPQPRSLHMGSGNGRSRHDQAPKSQSEPSIGTNLNPAGNRQSRGHIMNETRNPGRIDAPLVSVVMPVCNGENYLSPAVDSILSQSLSNIELIIVVNGSSDRSLDIAQGYAGKDTRVRVITLERGNISNALNAGIQSARAPWIARMDADDISLPTRLEKQLDYLERHPDVGALGTWGWRIGETGSRVSEFRIGPTTREEFEKIRNEDLLYMLSSSMVFSRQVATELGGFRADYPTAQDVEFWSRIADDHVVMAIPDMLVLYRIHEKSISTSSFRQQMQNAERARINVFRRRAGAPELTAEQFQEMLHQQVFLKRWIQDRKTRSQLCYRRAGGMLAAHDPKGMLWLLASLVLFPPLPLMRLHQQAVLPMLLSRIRPQSFEQKS